MAGMARAMGATLTTSLAKIKHVICSYWNLYFGPMQPLTANLHQRSIFITH